MGSASFRPRATFAAMARVGPIHAQAQRLDQFITDQELTGTAIVALPEEMPVNESAALEHDLRSEVGIAVDRIYMNGVYPERFSKAGGRAPRRARRLAGTGPCEGRHGRRSQSTGGPAPSAPSWRDWRRVKAPVRSLPFPFEPNWESGRPRAPRPGWADAIDRRHPSRQGDLHLRWLRRGGKDDDLSGDRRRHGRARIESLRAHD